MLPEVNDIGLAIAIGLALMCILTYFLLPKKSDGKNTAGSHGSKTANKNYMSLDSEQVSEQAEVVINAIDDGVIAIDSKGDIRLINPAAQRLIGWTGGDAVALSYRSVLQLVDAKDKPIPDASNPVLITLNANMTSESDRYSLVTSSGKRRVISLVVSPVGEAGSGAIIVFRDITKAKAEEREQAEFISTASHEMRTPVASIEGYLGLALNPNTAQIDEKARDFIMKAHDSARHLGRLFQDLLDVSRADDGRLSNYPKIVDAVEFIGTVVDGLQIKAREKGLRMNYIPHPNSTSNAQRTIAPVYFSYVDNDHLREVVSNLVENAIKYTHEGSVTVDVVGDERHINISVTDSGVGIPAEDIPHLFQKFYRVDNTDTREIGGTGLGLYLCRRLAEVMGGRIDLVSEFKKGSTFTLSIPRIDRETAKKINDEQEAVSAAAHNRPQPEVRQPDASALPKTPLDTTPTQVNSSATTAPQSPPAIIDTKLPLEVAPTPQPQSQLTPVAHPAQPILNETPRPTPNIQVPSRSVSTQNPPQV